MRKRLLTTLLLGLLSACAHVEIPHKEYVLAKAAFDAASATEAVKFAPQLYYKAEKSYKKAEQLFKDRYYEEAKKEFIVAKSLAEKAETAARVKQFNSTGEASQ